MKTNILSSLGRRRVEVWVVDNAREFDIQRLYCAEDADLTISKNYGEYSDEQLLKLSKDELAAIDDVVTLERLNRISKNLLTQDQINELSNYYADPNNRRIYPLANVNAVIDMIKHANRAWLSGRVINTQFSNDYETATGEELDEAVILLMLQQLTPTDYLYTLKSKRVEYLGNELFVFQPKHELRLKNNRSVIENVTIYVKLDTQTSTSRVISVISFHKAKFEEVGPYNDINNQ